MVLIPPLFSEVSYIKTSWFSLAVRSSSPFPSPLKIKNSLWYNIMFLTILSLGLSFLKTSSCRKIYVFPFYIFALGKKRPIAVMIFV